jgi:hypothetical protein
MKWNDSSLAYGQGFRDGWTSSYFGTVVENFNASYEIGFIIGWNEKRRRENKQEDKQSA